MKTFSKSFFHSILTTFAVATATSSHGFFLDGAGYFGTRGETRVYPEFQKDRGLYQATELSFDLNGEIRANDRASFHLRLGIFDDPSAGYLGDTSEPGTCQPRRSSTGGETDSTTCKGRQQSTTNSGYSSYKPVIREAYAKYAFNYCLLSAGRRSRDVGMGLLHSSAKRPFETDPSTFDGFTCDVNIQKQQDLGFYFGFDKLQETGGYIDNPYDRPTSEASRENEYRTRPTRGFGANSAGDDLDQVFFGLTLDDLKSKGQSSSFSKQVGIYFSNILGADSKTDVKYLDLYTGVYAGKLAFRNELIFRMGKTADPNIVAIGGLRDDPDGGTATNNVSSIGLAGEFEYTWAKSGASLGPSEFNEGNATRHLSFFTYAYAPGDPDGYYGGVNSFLRSDTEPTATKNRAEISETKRDKNAKAMAFHKNYKPALLFFNGKGTSRYLSRGGVYDPQRVMNASLFTLGYRYESQEAGIFDVKLITGRLIAGIPGEVKDYYAAREGRVAATNRAITASGDTSDKYRESNIDRPMGYSGQDLGYELDLIYHWQYRREVELGAGLAGALPGKAWDISADSSPTTQLGLFGSFALKF
ncbi:MAG: hypothetical protein NTV34_13695 [Proteobacteria bacterium]|nr:hypothetical protein [Pseudomonadota bacterium]